MKKLGSEPVFNIEMSHQARHLIMKRGQLLRGQRTRTMFVTAKTDTRSWLELRLIPEPRQTQDGSWNTAHDLASKINRELHVHVYAEPASISGRYNATIHGDRPFDSIRPDLSPVASPMSVAGIPGMPGVSPPAFGNNDDRRIASPFGSVVPPSNLANILDPTHGLPASWTPGTFDWDHKDTLKCSALYRMHGWNELPECEKQMFETEAAQLLHGGIQYEADRFMPESSFSKFEMLALHTHMSRSLRRFLERTYSAHTA